MFDKKIVVFIDGMSCAHCAKRVEDGLLQVDNVKSVKVNLDKKTATIRYKNNIYINSIKMVVEELDYKFNGTNDEKN